MEIHPSEVATPVGDEPQPQSSRDPEACDLGELPGLSLRNYEVLECGTPGPLLPREHRVL
jgi:hypothetical protein